MHVLPAKAVAGGESESDSPVFTADRLYEFSRVYTELFTACRVIWETCCWETLRERSSSLIRSCFDTMSVKLRIHVWVWTYEDSDLLRWTCNQHGRQSPERPCLSSVCFSTFSLISGLRLTLSGDQTTSGDSCFMLHLMRWRYWIRALSHVSSYSRLIQCLCAQHALWWWILECGSAFLNIKCLWKHLRTSVPRPGSDSMADSLNPCSHF